MNIFNLKINLKFSQLPITITCMGMCFLIFNFGRANANELKESKSGFQSIELAQAISRPSSNSVDCNCYQKITERLLERRIVVISQPIDDALAKIIVSQLLYIDSNASGKDIYLYINSPGGSVTSGMAILDTMQSLRSDVVTVSTGLSASMAALLLAGGTKGKRFALPNSRIMIHQPLGGAQGNVEDIESRAREILYLKKNINTLLAKFTNQSFDQIEADTDRDFFMSAQEAKQYGMIDQVIDKLP